MLSQSGFDTVVQCFDIGKSTVIKVFRSGVQLQRLGVLSEHIGDIIDEATTFNNKRSRTCLRYVE